MTAPLRRAERPVLIAYADGADTPRTHPAEVAARCGLPTDPAPEVVLGWTPDAPVWAGRGGTVRGVTFMAGYGLGEAVAEGRLRYLPTRLSAVTRALADVLRPDVLVVSGVRRGSTLAHGASVGWAPPASHTVPRVVVEVAADAVDVGAPLIEGNVVAVLEAPRRAAGTLPRALDDVDLTIGRHVAALLPDGATLELGVGGIPDAVLASVERPLRIWTGLATDGVAMLVTRGLVQGTVTAAYLWGGAPVLRLASDGGIVLRPVNETHDVSAVAAIPRFHACNSALQVGLDGSVNVERVGRRLVAGIGGHADYSAAASRSAGGLSIVALRATARGASTIVSQVTTVSTPRCDVQCVVTEHGVADLRGLDDASRADALIAVAAPEHRDELRAAR